MYRQMGNRNYSFWGSVPTAGLEIRKIHTGLPRLMINVLADITISDFNGVEFKDDNLELTEYWEQFTDENNFDDIIKKAFKQALYIGDGAFKFSIDTEISTTPILEWYGADRVSYKYERGRLREVIFNTQDKRQDGTIYILREHYGYGYVYYELLKNGNPCELADDEKYKDLLPIEFDKTLIMAVPLMFIKSEKYEGRGESIFEGKCDNFDALDEAWSQWIEALRCGRPTTYIPETLIPRDPNNGSLMKPNFFDNKFIKIGADLSENAQNKIDVEQPTIPHDSYLSTYVTALDLCLQGVISPSTLGIDVKKLDNAEAQREKEKTTLYTRQMLVSTLIRTIQNLVITTFRIKAHMKKEVFNLFDVEVNFGEYATPSFESVVETMSNPNTPMSVEAKVDELWGNSKSEDWKQEEIKRIKEQTGIVQLDEPAVNIDYNA